MQGGRFYRKVDKQGGQTPAGFKGWVNLERTHLLSVEDPKVRSKRHTGMYVRIYRPCGYRMLVVAPAVGGGPKSKE